MLWGATCAMAQFVTMPMFVQGFWSGRGDEGLTASLDDDDEGDTAERIRRVRAQEAGESEDSDTASYAGSEVLEDHPRNERRNDLDDVCFSVEDRFGKRGRKNSTNLVDFVTRPPAHREDLVRRLDPS
jgi:hypothetical protein